MKEYDIKENDVIEEFNPQEVRTETRGKIEQLFLAKRFDELAALIIEAQSNVSELYKTEKNEIINSEYDNYLKQLCAPPEGSSELSQNNKETLKALWEALQKERDKNIVLAGAAYDQWHAQIQKGSVKDTELYISNNENVRRLAHDFAFNQGGYGVKAQASVNAEKKIKKMLEQSGATIDGASGQAKLEDWAKTVNQKSVSEYGVKLEDYNEYVTQASLQGNQAEHIGFKVKKTKEIDTDNPFEDIPADLKTFKSFKNKYDVEHYVEGIEESYKVRRQYEVLVKDMVEEAKEILARLEATEPGHSKSQTYKNMHDALQNFTTLGTAYADPEFAEFGDGLLREKIVPKDVNQAFTRLIEAASEYETDHSGFSNLHRSNFGYGKTRLDISREIKKFSNFNKGRLSKYDDKKLNSMDTFIKKKKAHISLLNQYLAAKKIKGAVASSGFLKDNVPMPDPEMRKREVDIHRRPETPDLSFKNYMLLHTFEGGFKPKNRAEKIQAIAKVIVAYSQSKVEGARFSIDEIHKFVPQVIETYCLNDLSTTELNKALKNTKEAPKLCDKQRFGIYEPKGMKHAEFIAEMGKLKDTLIPKRGQSEAYKKVYDAATAVAELNQNANYNTYEARIAVTDANQKLLQAVSAYVKGNEKVKKNADERAAFNNVMDILSVVSKYTRREGMLGNDRALEVIDSVNKVRKDKEPIDKAKFENEYGLKRAQNAAQAKLEKEVKAPEMIKH